MTDIFLYQGEANPNDVKLRDPTTTGSGTNYTLVCSAGSYAYTGQAATLTVGRNLALAAGAYAYTGNAATLKVARSLSLAAGAYSYTGNDATLTYSPGTPAGINYTLSCSAGAYAYSGNAATLTYTPGATKVDYTLDCAPGAYSLAGMSADLSYVGTSGRVGGDDAFHPGWNKEAWQARKKKEDALGETIQATYSRILGIEPAPEVVAEIAAEVEKATPEDVAIADYSGLAEWLQAQERIVAQIIANRAEEDDEETLLLLI